MEISVPSLVRIKPKALYKIGKYLRDEDHRRIVLLWGEGMAEMLKPVVEVSLLSAEIEVVAESIATETEVEAIFQMAVELPSTVEAIVAIGGGKAIDIGKYLAFLKRLPLFSVPTAVSNDGFCSPMASLTVRGKKTSFRVELPQAVIVDTEVLQKAPAKFLYSGMGDLFCKITSVYDWKLAYRRTKEPVNDFAANMARSAADTFLYYDEKRLDNPDFLRVIATSLMMSGIAMEVARSSRPASGSEHLISHAYDKVAEKPSLHGLQVGVASYAVSLLQEKTEPLIRKAIEESGFLAFMRENPLSLETFREAVKLAPQMKENYYTILSEKGSVEKLLSFLEENEILRSMLK
ncbi:MAG: iron-containing alcohol dehydrogenase family protein [Brevinematales bacterium]|nr:iron-containing alcohol dehydrogenase family protein [Brevinematales bacterium]